jgi:hypothetical protein
MLYYCKKCGRIREIAPPENKKPEKSCDYCRSVMYPVPEKYWLDGLDFSITRESKKLLREELVKPSPEFDQYLFDHRDEDLAKRRAPLDKILKNAFNTSNQQSTKNIIKCPKCGSTAVTTTARGVNGFWGFIGASKTVNRCGNCGYTWKPNGR